MTTTSTRRTVPTTGPADWPLLPAAEWHATLATLHLWTQIVGKIRMELTPWINHSWGVPLYITSRGLTTSLIPYGARSFQLSFDFVDHQLFLSVTDGQTRSVPLQPQSVADFYGAVMAALAELDIEVTIHTLPNELPDPIPFDEDRTHDTYDPDHAAALWRALVHSHRVFTAFRARYIGKVSPIHFFWGSFDLALTRFSGRSAPPHPGGIPHLPDAVAREAYSHEVSSCGFWPGTAEAPDPIFYAYAYPTPDGYKDAAVRPEGAFWLDALGEFALPYDVVRASDTPDATLMEFLESTYRAAADLAGWEREALEQPAGFHPLR